MIFSGITPDEIYVWIDKKNNGDDSDYTNGKHDTKEAINVFQSLYGYTFKNEYRLFRYLFKHLCMREADSQSLYRAFIVLNNDEIITIRLSRHFATKNSANRAFNNYGKPKIEYHLVISRYQQPVNANKDVYYDMEISGVEIKVREYELSEFNDGNIRSGILDEIIKLLTYGDCPPANNENKQYNDMNRKIVRLTESDLRSIVKEAVNRIINEEGGFVGGATNASYGRDLMWQKNPTLYNDGSQSKRVGNMMKITRNGDTSYLANGQTPQSFKPVEESVNEVMYNGRPYHGNNSNDWGDLADEREKRMFSRDPNVGTKVSDMDSGQLLNHAKNGLDFSKIKSLDDRIDSKGNIHNDMNNMTPEGWQQWTKDASARMRNWGNYHATRNDYTPNQREQYSQEDYDKARSWNNYRNRGFNAALQQWNR